MYYKFRGTNHFVTIATNEPQMTMNTTVKSHLVPRNRPVCVLMNLDITRSKVSRICTTRYFYPNSQISMRFALRPAIFEPQVVTAILRQMQRMAPNRP